jgi:SAM-dependent methyltransferase
VSSIPLNDEQLLAQLLKRHPGVCQVAVIAHLGELRDRRRLIAYVLPDHDYIDTAFPEDESAKVKKWGKTFDFTQLSRNAGMLQAGFNIAGWNSSYTRQAIPADQMKEWVEHTVARILALKPTDVLEIGCGTGLLLFRIADQVRRYVATDVAPVVLRRLREEMTALPVACDKVTLLEREAENFAGFARGEFDTVVINSVIKYFPSAGYLTRVLCDAASLTRSGGTIFVGDIRHFDLLELYSFSVEAYQAPMRTSLAELRRRIARRMVGEEQLTVSPRFFEKLQQELPLVSHVKIQPKRGRVHNEMTRFRFDAFIHIGAKPEAFFEPEWHDWKLEDMSVDLISALLTMDRPESLAICNIPNARTEMDFTGLVELKRSWQGTVDELRTVMHETRQSGVDPEELWELAENNHYEVELSWKAGRQDGSLDAFLFRRSASSEERYRFIAWPDAVVVKSGPDTNVPGMARRLEKLVQELDDLRRQDFTDQVEDVTITLVDESFVGADGKIDLALVSRVEDTL